MVGIADSTSSDQSRISQLTSRVIKGGIWIFASNLASRGLQVVKLIVLARLLMPEDFGIFGIVTLALAAMETFTETGFQTALIQRKKVTDTYLDTAWTVQVLRGFFLAGVLFAAAPVFAWFFSDPRVTSLLRFLSTVEILRGLTNIGIIYFRKELEFRKQATYQLVSSSVALAVGVVLAWRLRNVWALVWAHLAGQVISTCLSYRLHPYRPRLRWDPDTALGLFGFGKWVMGNSIVQFLALQIDRIILGKLLGAASLGIYNMADRIGGVLPTEFMHLTNNVMMPAYAKVQDERVRLGRAFLRVFEVAVYIGGPSAAFIALTAPDLVPTLLGSEWIAAVVPMQILAVGGFLRCVVGVSSPIFLATGRPHIQFWKSFIRAVVTLVAVFPLTIFYGPVGTALATVLGVVALSPLFLQALRITGVSLSRLLSASFPGLLLTATTGLGVVPGKLISAAPVYAFSLQVAGSVLLTLIAVLLLRHHNLGPSVLIGQYIKILLAQAGISAASDA